MERNKLSGAVLACLFSYAACAADAQRWRRLIGQFLPFLKCKPCQFLPTLLLASLADFRSRTHPAFCRQAMNAAAADCNG